jgi:pimeloyl-ACP methyl ester carboxylesterase
MLQNIKYQPSRRSQATNGIVRPGQRCPRRVTCRGSAAIESGVVQTRNGTLELLSASPSTPPSCSPVLFIHGAFHGAWAWEKFMLYLADAGVASYALSFAGHVRSAVIKIVV